MEINTGDMLIGILIVVIALCFIGLVMSITPQHVNTHGCERYLTQTNE